MLKLLYVDLFCGAGGTSSGINTAKLYGERCAEVIACVNHDKHAILSHKSNHPTALHCTEDIRTLELSPLISQIKLKKKENPDALLVLWASLECTNFSRAKGGMSRDADSRTLAEHLFRYIEAMNPDYIQIENVAEFMTWGPLDKEGHPIIEEKGKSYNAWIENVKKYGYDFEYRILNSADYGAYTSRKRFFGIFAKHGLPITFPCPTHSCNYMRDGLKRWKPVKDVLDFSDEGNTIFRKRPLAESTLKRIYLGLLSYTSMCKDSFILKYNSVNRLGKHKVPSIDDPCPTVATQNRLGLVIVKFREEKDPCPNAEFQESDSEMLRNIKAYMKEYGIQDIKMRMLRVQELKRIMGFPDSYVLVGTKEEQRKFIGNAVEVNMSRALCEALCMGLVCNNKLAV